MSAVNEVDASPVKAAYAGFKTSPPASAYSRTGRRNHHYNLSEAHKNQFANVNIRRLQQGAPRTRHHRARRSMDQGQLTFDSPLKARLSLSLEKSSEVLAPGADTRQDPVNSDIAATEPTAQVEPKPEGHFPEPLEAQECPLAHPDFGPMGEIDHYVGRCYCHFCTCSLHICPNAYKRARLTQTLGASSYREAFRSLQGGEPAKQINVQPPYTANVQPMDFMTTTQRDYQPFTITSSPHSKPSTAPNSLKFTFRSSYQAEFPNWGSGDSQAEKRPQYPYRGDEVKMDLRTTYAQTYKLPPVKAEINKLNSTSTSFSVSAGSEFYGETTSQKEYRSPEKHHFAKLEPRRVEAALLQESPGKLHFKTMYQTQYKGAQQVYRRPNRVSSVS